MPQLLEVQDLRVEYVRDTGPVQVLKGVSFNLSHGEALGIVGESGSGKSVLLRAILGLLDPPWRIASGRILLRGEDLLKKSDPELQRIRGKTMALTPSNPRQHLNPVLGVGKQITNVILAHNRHIPREHAAQRTLKLLSDVGIPDPTARYFAYPHELSGGMCQRIVIAMGLVNSPDLLLADEPTSGIDVTLSIQILDLMRDLVRDVDSALLLVSRDLGVVANYCQRVVVMYRGEIAEEDNAYDFFDHPTHPYSRHLIRAAEAARDSARDVESTVSRSVGSDSMGCRYASRCPVALDACREKDVQLEPLKPGHKVRCIRKNEIDRGELNP